MSHARDGLGNGTLNTKRPSGPVTAMRLLVWSRTPSAVAGADFCIKVRLHDSFEQRGAYDGPDEEICCRGDRHILAHVRWLRFSGHRSRGPTGRDRIARRLAGLRPHRAHDGL